MQIILRKLSLKLNCRLAFAYLSLFRHTSRNTYDCQHYAERRKPCPSCSLIFVLYVLLGKMVKTRAALFRCSHRPHTVRAVGCSSTLKSLRDASVVSSPTPTASGWMKHLMSTDSMLSSQDGGICRWDIDLWNEPVGSSAHHFLGEVHAPPFDLLTASERLWHDVLLCII